MKVKTMKKVLSVLCASAMVAGTFAVADMGTVEAAVTWSPDSVVEGNVTYGKVPFGSLVCNVGCWSTTEGGKDVSGKAMVDGQTNTFYHSNYGTGQGTIPNFAQNLNNKIVLEFAGRDISGISYLKRQDGDNGKIKKAKLRVRDAQGAWSDVAVQNGAGTAQNEVTLNAVNEKEFVIPFQNVAKSVTAVEITVLDAQTDNTGKNMITGAELSVLTPMVTGAVVESDGSYEISKFVYDTNKRMPAPKKEGKVFAGWFKDATFKTPLTSEVTGKAFPKYVNEAVLGTKTQVLASTDTYSANSNLRFVSSVDSLDYKEAGFYIYRESAKGAEGTMMPTTKMNRVSITQVYEVLKVMNGSDTIADVTPQNTFDSTESKYFFAVNLRNVPSANFETSVKAVPFWVTKDGVEVLGAERNSTVNEAVDRQYLSKVTYNYNAQGQTTGLKTTDPNFVNLAKYKDNNQVLTVTGAWAQWPTNAFGRPADNNQWILGQKFETSGTVAANSDRSLEFKFGGTGIAVYAQLFGDTNRDERVCDIQIVDADGKVVKNIQKVKTGCPGPDNTHQDKVLIYSARGLQSGNYTMKINNIVGGVSIDSVYVVDRTAPVEAQ